MDSLLILTIAISLVTVLANLALGFGEDSRDGFGRDSPVGFS